MSKFLKVNLDNVEEELERIGKELFEKESDKTIEITTNNEQIYLISKAKKKDERVCLKIHLSHKQYDFQSETIYGFFEVMSSGNDNIIDKFEKIAETFNKEIKPVQSINNSNAARIIAFDIEVDYIEDAGWFVELSTRINEEKGFYKGSMENNYAFDTLGEALDSVVNIIKRFNLQAIKGLFDIYYHHKEMEEGKVVFETDEVPSDLSETIGKERARVLQLMEKENLLGYYPI